MTDDTSKWIWKGFTLILGFLIVPIFAWVWSTQGLVADLQNDLGHLEVKVAALEVDVKVNSQVSTEIARIQSDIKHMGETLVRIEGKLP